MDILQVRPEPGPDFRNLIHGFRTGKIVGLAFERESISGHFGPAHTSMPPMSPLGTHTGNAQFRVGLALELRVGPALENDNTSRAIEQRFLF